RPLSTAWHVGLSATARGKLNNPAQSSDRADAVRGRGVIVADPPESNGADIVACCSVRMKEAHAEPFLHPRHRLADRRRRHAKLPSSNRETSGSRRLNKGIQRSQRI